MSESYYVYLHRKATTGEVFYVGKGKGDRYKSKAGRNSLWKRIATKHGFVTEIVEDNLQEWYAFELENNLVNYYGRIDLGQGTLANMTDGGYDNQNFSAYTRKVIHEKLSGLNCYKADKTLYNFFNIDTNETFHGTRIDFSNKYNVKSTQRMFNTQFREKAIACERWVVLEFCSQERIKEILSWNMHGAANPNADLNEYTFCNYYTNEEFKGTRVDFKRKFNVQTNALFSNKCKVRICNGWFVRELTPEYKPYDTSERKSVDKNKYKFLHKKGDVFVGTRLEFTAKHGFSPYHLFGNKPSKSVHGWSLVV